VSALCPSANAAAARTAADSSSSAADNPSVTLLPNTVASSRPNAIAARSRVFVEPLCSRACNKPSPSVRASS
jgi:hypothetical protein